MKNRVRSGGRENSPAIHRVRSPRVSKGNVRGGLPTAAGDDSPAIPNGHLSQAALPHGRGSGPKPLTKLYLFHCRETMGLQWFKEIANNPRPLTRNLERP